MRQPDVSGACSLQTTGGSALSEAKFDDSPVAAETPQSGLRRHRLTLNQVKILESAFLNDPEWSKQDVKELAAGLDLSRVKIYKWHYDRKKGGLGTTYAALIVKDRQK